MGALVEWLKGLWRPAPAPVPIRVEDRPRPPRRP
jgi:hypothetical protein